MKKKAAMKREGGRREEEKEINEGVCCDPGSHTGTIITIHQDNE